jgi:hypothetical protein
MSRTTFGVGLVLAGIFITSIAIQRAYAYGYPDCVTQDSSCGEPDGTTTNCPTAPGWAGVNQPGDKCGMYYFCLGEPTGEDACQANAGNQYTWPCENNGSEAYCGHLWGITCIYDSTLSCVEDTGTIATVQL